MQLLCESVSFLCLIVTATPQVMENEMVQVSMVKFLMLLDLLDFRDEIQNQLIFLDDFD
jgi:hypothetical protein